MKIGHKTIYHLYDNNEFINTHYFYDLDIYDGLHRLMAWNKAITHEYHYCLCGTETVEMKDNEEYYPKVYIKNEL